MTQESILVTIKHYLFCSFFMSREFNIEEKIYQGFLLLTAHDEFIKDVKKIRKDYDISWIIGNEEEVFYENFLENLNSGNFFNHEISEYDSEDVLGIDDVTDTIKYGRNKKFKSYHKDLSNLMKKYNLPKDYDVILDVFVQQDFVVNHNFIGKYIDPYFDEKEDCVVVKVYANTSKRDYDRNWVAAQYMLTSLLKGKRSLKKNIDNLERDVKIKQLKFDGKTAKEIVRIINDSNKFDNKLSGYDEVHLIINKLNKRIKKFLTLQER